MSATAVAGEERRIRELRPEKPAVDPWRAHGSIVEAERRPNGDLERALTIFLAGAECPFTCSFCDLWRWTINGPTPLGALPAQIDEVLRSTLAGVTIHRVKLYNASNFFDRRAVPPDDWAMIAALVASFRAVTVESHASMVAPAAVRFAQCIAGRLEVAIGLETIHPVAIQHLNKRLELSAFDRAVDYLRSHEIDVRVFVLLGAPYVPAAESIPWTERAVQYAVERGASMVSIIPVRGGNGELKRLQSLGNFTPPTLNQLEQVLDQCLTLAPTVVSADLWDIERFVDCATCAAARVERLKRMNETGLRQPAVECDCIRGVRHL